jgi:predicted  nucleic acid-binding Zn ribbon protein
MAKGNPLSWPSIKGYLQSIGMISDVDIQVVKEIFSQGKVLCPEELEAIFISNYKETDGKEQFKDLWLFSDNYVIEALNFSKKETPKLEMAIFSNNIQVVAFEANNLDFSQKAKDDSRLHVVFYTYNIFSCDQIASGRNCDALMSIYKKYIKNNLVRVQPSGLE